MIPGFFKRGAYAKRIRAMQAGMITLEGVDDGLVVVTTSSTIKTLVLTTSGIVSVEYEAFGYLAGKKNSNDKWTLQVLDPAFGALTEIVVEVHPTGAAALWRIPFYIRGRDVVANFGIAGYGLQCSENIGGGTLNVLAARLYGIR